MKKYIAISFAIAFMFTTNVYATNDFTGCGLAGTLEVKSKPVAAIINWISGITFVSATTSGTSGCSGLTYMEQEQEQFIAVNHQTLKENIVSGQGVHLETFSQLMGCTLENQNEFTLMMRSQTTDYLATETSVEFLRDVQEQIRNHAVLSESCKVAS